MTQREQRKKKKHTGKLCLTDSRVVSPSKSNC